MTTMNDRELALVGLMGAILTRNEHCQKCMGHGYHSVMELEGDPIVMVCEDCVKPGFESAMELVERCHFALPDKGKMGMLNDIVLHLNDLESLVRLAASQTPQEDISGSRDLLLSSMGYDDLNTCPECGTEFSEYDCVQVLFRDRETKESHGGTELFCREACAKKFCVGEDFEIEEFID